MYFAGIRAPELTVSAGSDSASLNFTITPSTPVSECVTSYNIVAVGADSERNISVPASEVEGVVTAGGFGAGLYVFHVCPVNTRGGLGPCSDNVAHRIPGQQVKVDAPSSLIPPPHSFPLSLPPQFFVPLGPIE